MFSPRYAGNLAVAILFFVVIVIAQVVGSTAELPGGVDALLTLLAIGSAVGILVFLGAAAMGRKPRLDWSDDKGEHLHPQVKAGLQALGVVGVGLAGLAFYIALYIFKWPVFIIPMVLLAIAMLVFVVYLTAGKHMD
ncbi:hypothetical protein C882_3926 [Caenispirillum salinarum AK4]|uniref:Uncharacterized protein n=1 Tax=Caenispirillum salinarum AK4 TaxID=1238182 RepID=K9HML2_9PROT|nr:hypothetical protein [Caenispirillum salinarum]EKV31553.1 hypothetical protein C882_3926 [Caenispirillum salinarum AK4]